MRITDGYLFINRRVEAVEKIISVIIISSIVLIVFTGTIARYFFNDPLFGADRLATYLMIWLGFIGFQIAVSHLRHIEIEVVKTKLKEKTRQMMNIVSCLIASSFLFVFSYLSWIYMNESRLLDDRDTVLDIPFWWIILVIPVSFSLSAIRYIFNALLWYDILKEKRKQDDIFRKQLL